LPGIAVGAYLNNRVCVNRGLEAFVSPPIGDLDNRTTCEKFSAVFSDLPDTLQVEPRWIAADLHPDFYSTRVGRAFADTHNLPFIQVQHHHAHAGSVMAEHQLTGPVLGLALDGFGLGSDGAAWGGELLLVKGAHAERLGCLRPLALPGGDRAAREPWRMAAAVLFDLGRRDEIVTRFGAPSAMIATMIEKGLNSPRTSSAGRLFDAAAGLLGIKPVAGFEAEAAILLENLAASFGAVEPIQSCYSIDNMTLDMLPLLARLADMREPANAAALFHASLAEALADWVLRAADRYRVDQIAFGGGCFLNRVLSRTLRARLEQNSLNVFEAERVSPGDGGLCLGQAWVAMQVQLETSHS
jgi:hydrogenase maturation protein HypF